MDCNEVLEQLADYLDQDARQELCRAIEDHLGQCRDCHLYVDSVKKTIILYQADRVLEMPTSVSAKLEEALARAYAAKSDGPTD